MRLQGTIEPVGTAEIADLLGVKQVTVHAWRRRHADFPQPWRVLATGPIWSLAEIVHWASRRRVTRGRRAKVMTSAKPPMRLVERL
jgi:predicted DNA-binding transcriptional regulator AlpA